MLSAHNMAIVWSKKLIQNPSMDWPETKYQEMSNQTKADFQWAFCLILLENDEERKPPNPCKKHKPLLSLEKSLEKKLLYPLIVI